jgi:hypothetical protein
MKPKVTTTFTFIYKTDHGNGRIIERVMTETGSRERARRLWHTFRSICGGSSQVRLCKKVVVHRVNWTRFRLFNGSGTEIPFAGQIFNSIDSLAQEIGANPVTLRAALSRARRVKKNKNGCFTSSNSATVRGVTYAYAA